MLLILAERGIAPRKWYLAKKQEKKGQEQTGQKENNIKKTVFDKIPTLKNFPIPICPR